LNYRSVEKSTIGCGDQILCKPTFKKKFLVPIRKRMSDLANGKKKYWSD
jgi:hypothetical protein